MAKNNIDHVKNEIQQLAIGNYKSYPQEYEETTITEAVQNVDSLAKGYWDSRMHKEIARDERLGISLTDYQQWTKEAYEAFMTANGHSLN